MGQIAKRICRACQQEKPLDKFNRQSRGKPGRRSMCRACEQIQRKASGWKSRGCETAAGFTKEERARWTRNLAATIERLRTYAKRAVS